MDTLETLIKKLPAEMQEEVIDFIKFLSMKKMKKKSLKLKMDWVGAFKDLRDRYTSTELQHKILEWRSGKE